LPTDVPDDIQGIASPFSQIQPEPEEIVEMRDRFNNLSSSIEGRITEIADTPIEVDAKALVGQINARFGKIRNRITESALMSVQKAGLDLDTYFGSPQGDQRSGVRAKMAANVKNSMMQSAFRAIADVYDKNTEMIVSAELEGAKINVQAAATKARAIADFTGLATQAYLGVLSETNKSYATRLNASVQWAQVQAQARGQDIQFATAMKGLEVTQRGQDLQAGVAQRGQDIGATTTRRGQDIGSETTRRGQDIQEKVSFAQIANDSERIQLERDKANLQASLAVWGEQGSETQQRWTRSMGGGIKTASDFGSWGSVTTHGMFGSTTSRNLFSFSDNPNSYFTSGGGYL